MTPASTHAAKSESEAPDVFRPWLLAATVLLFAARPLMPSEGTIGSSDAILFDALPLVFAAAAALRACMRRGATARYGWVDLLVVLLVVATAASAAVAMRRGAPRPAMNALWQTVGLATLFLLIRQLVVTARETRAIAAVMLGLAVTQSVYGFHQFFISIPRDQESFKRDEDAALREAGVFAPPGSRQRELFAQRINSSEPMGTFALANSLAGFLAPWLVVSVGIVAVAAWRRRQALALWGPAAVVAIVLAACVVLTKSRAAVLAVLCGCVALAAVIAARGVRLPRWGYAVAVLIVLLLGVGAAAVGAVDREVLTEAGKSLGYRLQYWKSTVAMIRDYPWVGCGPGQFQNYYTQYKLPEASETVADPHNFLLEEWGTTGTPAALLLVALIGLVAWRVVRFAPTEEVTHKTADERPMHGAEASAAVDRSSKRQRRAKQSATAREPSDASTYVLGAGLAAYLFAVIIGPLAVVPLSMAACAVGMLTSAAVIAGLWAWIRSGELPVFVLALAALALLVNLSAAGGLSFAGVAGTLWLLAALCLAATEPLRPLPRVAAAGALGTIVVAIFCFYVSTYRPVMSANLDLDRAMVQVESADVHLRRAAEADPLSAEPLRRAAMLEWAVWRQHPSSGTFDRFLTAIDAAMVLDPHAAGLAELKGDICFEVYRHSGQPPQLVEAVSAYRRAVELYPTSISGHAKLAMVLADSGQKAAAAAEAAEALRLHELTPHADLKLPPEMLKSLEPLTASPN